MTDHIKRAIREWYPKACGGSRYATRVLQHLTTDLAAEKSARLKAEAVVAEMRSLIDYALVIPFADTSARKLKVEHAFSSDCGKGWLSPEVADKVRSYIELPVVCCNDAEIEARKVLKAKALALLDGKETK